MSQKLKYLGSSIVFQEVPNEISLAINISGCPHHCEGCHSIYLWDYSGRYIEDDLDMLLDKFKSYITCVCFMGGDQNEKELRRLVAYIHSRGFKACLYTGLDNVILDSYDYLDYIKVGSYRRELGGLDSINTNQRMYKRTNNGFDDITYLFNTKGKI